MSSCYKSIKRHKIICTKFHKTTIAASYRVYNSVSGTTLGFGLTRPSAQAHTTCRIGPPHQLLRLSQHRIHKCLMTDACAKSWLIVLTSGESLLEWRYRNVQLQTL